MNYEALIPFGWNQHFQSHFQPYGAEGFEAGRVALEYNQFYRVYTAAGEILAETTGKLRYEAASRAELPAVGDWVALKKRDDQEHARIQAILPRTSCFTRKVVDRKTEEQVVGANIDTVLLMTSLNQDFKPRRLERYIAVAVESGARPVLILSKADLCDDLPDKLVALAALAEHAPIHAVSAREGLGLEALAPYFVAGQTVAILGSSGVGKSTLVNHLMGFDRQKVKEIRVGDGEGMHATRHRELIVLPSGGLVLDTPGMRELQLWQTDEGMDQVFGDVEALIAACRFSNCSHKTEPGCAVRVALADGTLEVARYHNYVRLQGELTHLAQRQESFAALKERKQRWKKLAQAGEERGRSKRGD
ncbi:MAG: ribosome small subunit-dependent GTPase A [Acidobacteria bacterium]|nr:ribosome small subunit-dependent GTPase A [Acidobacteriota bacterium]